MLGEVEHDMIMSAGWRVKVYRLSEVGQWDDRGTGIACIKTGPPAAIIVSDESMRGRQLLEATIRHNEAPYKKQGENIITLDADPCADAGTILAETLSAPSQEAEDERNELVKEDNISMHINSESCVSETKEEKDEYSRKSIIKHEFAAIPRKTLPQASITIALSFQETQGCEDVWQRLNEARRPLLEPEEEDKALVDRAAVLTNEGSPCAPGVDENGRRNLFLASKPWAAISNSKLFLTHALGARGTELSAQLEKDVLDTKNNYAHSGDNGKHGHTTTRQEEEENICRPLPPMWSLENCREWLHCLARAALSVPAMRERYAAALAADGAALLRQMAAYFENAENSNEVVALLQLADISKLLILLNEPVIIECILEQPIFEAVIGALEYAADLKHETTATPPRGAHQQIIPQSPLTPRSFAPLDDDDDACSVLQAASPANCRNIQGGSPPTSADSRIPLPPSTPRSDFKKFNTSINETTVIPSPRPPQTAAAARRIQLRESYARRSRKIVVQFDEILAARIEQHARARILRDAVLRPGLDESQLSALHSMVFWSANDILQRLEMSSYTVSSRSYLSHIVTAVLEPKRCRDALLCLREMIRLARLASAGRRDSALASAMRCGLYKAISKVLSSSPTTELKACCVDILLATIRSDASAIRLDALAASQSVHDPTSSIQPVPPRWLLEKNKQRAKALLEARSHSRHNNDEHSEDDDDDDDDDWDDQQQALAADQIILPLERTDTQSSQAMTEVSSSQGSMRPRACLETDDENASNKNYTVLYWLCRLADDKEEAIASAAVSSLRLVLETETMPDRDPFLNCLYEFYMPWLISPLLDTDDASSTIQTPARAQLCEVLAYCVHAHGYRLKYLILKSNVALRIVSHAANSETSRSFRLAAVRFIRACVSVKDDFYARYLIKNNIIGPIIALASSCSPDSLVSSSIAELLEFVRAENLKLLNEHIVRCHASKLQSSPTLISLLMNLRTRLAQNEDAVHRATVTDTDLGHFQLGTLHFARRERIALEDRDEAYFEDSDDEDDHNPTLLSTKKKNKNPYLMDSPRVPLRPNALPSQSKGASSDSEASTQSSTSTKRSRDDSENHDDAFVPRESSVNKSENSPIFFTAKRNTEATRRTHKHKAVPIKFRWSGAQSSAGLLSGYDMDTTQPGVSTVAGELGHKGLATNKRLRIAEAAPVAEDLVC